MKPNSFPYRNDYPNKLLFKTQGKVFSSQIFGKL